MMTVLCCEVQPAVIAVGSIYLAASDLELPLPQETLWYELFDVTWEDVVKVCSTIRESYTWPAVAYTNLASRSHDCKREEKLDLRKKVKLESENHGATDVARFVTEINRSPPANSGRCTQDSAKQSPRTGSNVGSHSENLEKPSGLEHSSDERRSGSSNQNESTTEHLNADVGPRDRRTESSPQMPVSLKLDNLSTHHEELPGDGGENSKFW